MTMNKFDDDEEMEEEEEKQKEMGKEFSLEMKAYIIHEYNLLEEEKVFEIFLIYLKKSSLNVSKSY